jgi:phage shock protein PspC (stress-responsive transcriptional regulator)
VGASFFAWIRSLGITRGDDAWIAGVCSGIAARTGLDPRLVRGIAIVVAILGGPVFLAYAVGWALLPDSRGHIHAESAVHGVFTYPMIFIGIAAILTFLPFTRGIWFDGAPHIWGMPDWLEVTLRTLWILALIGGAIWLTVAIARSVPRKPAPGWPAGGTPTAPGAGATPGAPAAAPNDTTYAATTTPDAASAPTGSVNPTDADSDAATAEATRQREPHATAGAFAGDPSATAGAWSSHAAWTTSDWHRERHDQARERAARAHDDARARAAAWRAAHPQPQGAGAAFASVVLGIALVAAAVVGIGYGAVVPDGKLVLVVSIAALAVIAVGIVVAGIRGRTSGGLGPFAFLLAGVVVFTGVLPAGTEVLPFGTQNVDVSQAVTSGPDSYLLLAGKTVVDAQDLSTRSPDGSIDVWLASGQTEVLLPEGVPLRVESHVFAGTVTSALGTERSGVFVDDDRFFPATGSAAGIPADSTSGSRATDAHVPVIRIWLLAGNVKLVTENER